jgi:hypothetical protein
LDAAGGLANGRAKLADFDRNLTALSHIAVNQRSALMAFRTNYRFERAERDRVKAAKKEEKTRRQQERAALPPEAGDPVNPAEDTPSDK